MTFGLDPYGLGAYGGAPTGISIDHAYASTTNSVVVVTTAPALQDYGFEAGSALNPATWVVSRTDTGDTFTVLGVRALAADTFELWTLESFAPWQVTHEVKSTSLRSAIGLVVTNPNAADFPGVVSDYDPDPARLPQLAARDLANPRPGARVAGVDGTLQITGGDYVSDEEPELTRKLLLRRYTTPRGAFRHLPTFGLSVRVEDVIYGATPAMAIQREIVEQSLAEPTVRDAAARVTVNPAKGIVVADVYITLVKADPGTLAIGLSFDRQNNLIRAA